MYLLFTVPLTGNCHQRHRHNYEWVSSQAALRPSFLIRLNRLCYVQWNRLNCLQQRGFYYIIFRMYSNIITLLTLRGEPQQHVLLHHVPSVIPENKPLTLRSSNLNVHNNPAQKTDDNECHSLDSCQHKSNGTQDQRVSDKIFPVHKK